MAVGCTERPSNDPVKPADQVLAQEKKAGGEAAPGIEVEATDDGISVQGKASEGGFFRRQEKDLPPEEVERQLSKLGPVRLELSDLPPTADPVESGSYLLSIVIQLTSGSFNKDQWPCRVEVDGPQVTILLENRQTDPIFATLEDGHFLSEPREGQGTYGLEGQVVGPGKVRGVVLPGPEDHPSIGIVKGRWGLDALPLPEESGAEKKSDK